MKRKGYLVTHEYLAERLGIKDDILFVEQNDIDREIGRFRIICFSEDAYEKPEGDQIPYEYLRT